MTLKISIIIVCFNEEKGISDTIESVLNQNYKNYQLIVVDGKSTDNTINILSSYKNKINLLISEKDNGVYFAMNRGLEYVNGDIIGFLNGGDRLTDTNVFSDIVNKFSDLNVAYVYGNKAYFSKKNKKKIIRKWRVGELQREKISQGWSLPHLSTYIRKEIFSKIGNFNTQYKIAADFDFLTKMISNNNYKHFYLDRYLVEMEQGGISNSNIINVLKANYECYLSLKKNKFKPSPLIIFLKPIKKIFQIFR